MEYAHAGGDAPTADEPREEEDAPSPAEEPPPAGEPREAEDASDADTPVGDLSSFNIATPSSSACARIVAKQESTGVNAATTPARHGVYFRASRRSNQGLKSPSVTRCTSMEAQLGSWCCSAADASMG